MTTLFASAQFMVITTVTEASDDSDGFEAEQVTDKVGLGYMLNDNFTIGVQRTGEDENGDTTFDMFAAVVSSRSAMVISRGTVDGGGAGDSAVAVACRSSREANGVFLSFRLQTAAIAAPCTSVGTSEPTLASGI